MYISNPCRIRQPPFRAIPHRVQIAPDDIVLLLDIGLVGSCPGGNFILGIVVLVGNSWAWFFIQEGGGGGGGCPQWGVVLEPSHMMFALDDSMTLMP